MILLFLTSFLFEYTEEDLPLEALIDFPSISADAYMSTFPLLLNPLEIAALTFLSITEVELRNLLGSRVLECVGPTLTLALAIELPSFLSRARSIRDELAKVGLRIDDIGNLEVI